MTRGPDHREQNSTVVHAKGWRWNVAKWQKLVENETSTFFAAWKTDAMAKGIEKIDRKTIIIIIIMANNC